MAILDATQIVADLTALVEQVNTLNSKVKDVMMKARRLQDQVKMDEIRLGQGLGA